MFRNALRQSSRTVGAISASGRVAAVSLPYHDASEGYTIPSRGARRDLNASSVSRWLQLSIHNARSWPLGALFEASDSSCRVFFGLSAN
jgi:hypothetical protein